MYPFLDNIIPLWKKLVERCTNFFLAIPTAFCSIPFDFDEITIYLILTKILSLIYLISKLIND